MHIELEKCADRWVGCANRFSREEMTESDNAPSFSDLPEGYITDILSITSPHDACRATSISKASIQRQILMPFGTGFCRWITAKSSPEQFLP
ncbi:putative F-box-like domain superfamily protein [Helianthus anomalus]